MKSQVVSIAGKQPKIFNAIVHSVFIYMMNNLVGFQISPKVFFHNQSMFGHIIRLSGGGDEFG